MEILSINAEERKIFGGTKSRALLRQGMIPGVLYGKKDGKNIVLHFQLDARDVEPLHLAPYFINLNLNKQTYRCIVKDMQTHPVSDITTHIDLLLISDDQPIVMEIPLQLEGKAIGERAGGILIKKIRKLKIRSLPAHMPSEIKFDVSDLKLGKTAKIRALKADKYEILNQDRLPLAAVDIPRALRSKAGQAAIDLESETVTPA